MNKSLNKYQSPSQILAMLEHPEWMYIFLGAKRMGWLDGLMDWPLEKIEKSDLHSSIKYVQEAADRFFTAAQMCMDVQEGRRTFISLWDMLLKLDEATVSSPDKEAVFLLAPKPEKGETRKPAVIIVPGGAYSRVAFSGEGNPVLQLMEANGYVSFLLNYRTNAPFPAAMNDLAKAVQYVRENAETYDIDPDKIVVIGFSAGGHLAASLTAHYEDLASGKLTKEFSCPDPTLLLPDALVLGYPVIDFTQYGHEESFQNLKAPESMREYLSIHKHVHQHFPPTCLWHNKFDETVDWNNSRVMKEALRKAGIHGRYSIYNQPGHGMGLAYGTQAQEWSEDMLKFLEKVLSGPEKQTV